MASHNESFAMTGSCLCGGIKVTLKQNVLSKPIGHICYCSNCRKYTGSIGLNALRTKKDKVHIRDPKGLIKTYEDYDTTSGNCVERHFCSKCSSPILFTALEDEVGCTVALGIFSRTPKPEYEFFMGQKPEWQPSIAAKTFDRSPSALEIKEDV